MILPCCYQQCLVELMKWWMIVMKYEGECIRNMDWVKSYKNFVRSEKTTDITLLLPTIFYWINETMNEIDEVWRWMYWKYGMSPIVQKLHSVEKRTALTLLLPTMFDWINKTMNGSDEIWRRVHQKYGMSWIVKKNWYGYGHFGWMCFQIWPKPLPMVSVWEHRKNIEKASKTIIFQKKEQLNNFIYFLCILDFLFDLTYLRLEKVLAPNLWALLRCEDEKLSFWTNTKNTRHRTGTHFKTQLFIYLKVKYPSTQYKA